MAKQATRDVMLVMQNGDRIHSAVPVRVCTDTGFVRWPVSVELEVEGKRRSFIGEPRPGGRFRYHEEP